MADISKIKIPSGITYNLKDSTARAQILTFQNQILNLANAATDTTFSGYPYAIKLPLAGVTAQYVPSVVLKDPSSLISDICETGDGYIKFFVTTNSGTITLDTIKCAKGGN